MDKLSNYLRFLDGQDQEKQEEREYYWRRLLQQNYRYKHEYNKYKNN